MSTKITIEEYERVYKPNTEKYHVLAVQVEAHNMERAANFIESMRAMHSKYNVFIKHTCECTPDGLTIWKFVYLKEEFRKYTLEREIFKAWDAAFEEVLKCKAEKLSAFARIGHGNPCVCPFSMK